MALRHHRPDGGTGGPQRSEEVELHRPLEVVVGDLEEAAQAEPNRSHVVDEHVEPTVFVEGAPDELTRRAGFGEVDRDPDDPRDALEAGDGASSRDDAGSFVGQRAGHCQPDALARASDDRDLAVQHEDPSTSGYYVGIGTSAGPRSSAMFE